DLLAGLSNDLKSVRLEFGDDGLGKMSRLCRFDPMIMRSRIILFGVLDKSGMNCGVNYVSGIGHLVFLHSARPFRTRSLHLNHICAKLVRRRDRPVTNIDGFGWVTILAERNLSDHRRDLARAAQYVGCPPIIRMLDPN